MKNNIYLYLMLISLLAGGFAGFIGYDHLENSKVKEQENELLAKEIEAKEAEKMAKETELQNQNFKRRALQTDVRELANAIEEQQGVKAEYKALEERLRQSIQLQQVKFTVNQEGVSAMQDQLAEDTIAVDRASENMRAVFALDRQRLEQRQNVLTLEEEKDTKSKAKRMSELDTAIDAVEFNLRRVNNLSATELQDPWVVGQVLVYNATLNKVVINLGKAAGVKQNFKFSIFSADQGNNRNYKGYVIVKEVHDLISIGVMEMENRDTLDPVAGDSIGSLVYRRDTLNYYLGGDFRSKYSKDQLKSFIEYSGNHVLPELSADVDFFVMGSLAENEVPQATALGVAIIPEELISIYLGE